MRFCFHYKNCASLRLLLSEKKQTKIARQNRTILRWINSAKIWSGWRGSNPLPPPWQGGALPDELHPHFWHRVGNQICDSLHKQTYCTTTIFLFQVVIRKKFTADRQKSVCPPFRSANLRKRLSYCYIKFSQISLQQCHVVNRHLAVGVDVS